MRDRFDAVKVLSTFFLLSLFLITSQVFGQTASLESSVAEGGKPADFESCAARFEAAPDACPMWQFEPALLELEKKGGYLWPTMVFSPQTLQMLRVNNRTFYDYAISVNYSFRLAFFPDARSDERNHALPYLNRTVLRLAVGDYYDAEDYVAEALRTVERIKQKGGVIAGERWKMFKGEPYERAMASIYWGLALYLRGDYQNARAMFARALDIDKETAVKKKGKKNEILMKYGQDFGLAHYLLGRAYYKLGEIGSARIAMRKATEFYPCTKARMKENLAGRSQRNALMFSPPGMYMTRSSQVPVEFPRPSSSPYTTLDALANDNLVLLIEMGRAPGKVQTGSQGQRDRFAPVAYPERKALVYVDGRKVGESYCLVDLTHQALTLPRTGKDKVQTGKMVGKWAAVALTRVISKDLSETINNKWSVAADTRIWGTLPGQVDVFSAYVSPGKHTLTIMFYDSEGNLLPRFEQTWHGIVTADDQERFMLLRAKQDRCNASVPYLASKIVKVKKKKERREIRFSRLVIGGANVGDELYLVQIGDPQAKGKRIILSPGIVPVNGMISCGNQYIGVRVKRLGIARVTRVKNMWAYADVLGSQAVPITPQDFVTKDPRQGQELEGYSNAEVLK